MKNVVARLQHKHLAWWEFFKTTCLSPSSCSTQLPAPIKNSSQGITSSCMLAMWFDIRHFSLIKGTAGSMCSIYPRTKKVTYLSHFHRQSKV